MKSLHRKTRLSVGLGLCVILVGLIITDPTPQKKSLINFNPFPGKRIYTCLDFLYHFSLSHFNKILVFFK